MQQLYKKEFMVGFRVASSHIKFRRESHRLGVIIKGRIGFMEVFVHFQFNRPFILGLAALMNS